MRIRNTVISIHFIRNSNGNYSVDIRKFVVKVLATVLVLYAFVSSMLILVQGLVEEEHYNSLQQRLEFCESNYARGDYAALQLSLKYSDSEEKEFEKYKEIVDAYQYELEALAFYNCKEEGVTVGAGERFEEAVSKLEDFVRNSEYQGNVNTIKKWLQELGR